MASISRQRLTGTRLAVDVVWAGAVTMVLFMLTVALGGCGGGQAKVIRTVLDFRAIDVSAKPGPATLPSLSTGVPEDSVLEQTMWVARPGGQRPFSRSWWDVENQRLRRDAFGDPREVGLGPTTTAIDPETATIASSVVRGDGMTLSYDAVWGDLTRDSLPAGSEIEEGMSGDDPADAVALLGQQHLGATLVDVYRVDIKPLEDPEPDAGPPLTHGFIYVDATTKLRQREEWLTGSPDNVWVQDVYEYRLLPRTPEMEARFSSQALRDLAAAALAAKKEELKKLDFPVWGPPDGTDGLVLSGIEQLGTGRIVLKYTAQGTIGGFAAVWIGTDDLRGRTDPTDTSLAPRDQAQVEEGEDATMFFRMNQPGAGGHAGYDTAVDIESNDGIGKAASVDVKALAAALIDLRETAAAGKE